MTESVRIIEVGPHDGLQNEPKIVGTCTKLDLIRRLVDAASRILTPGRLSRRNGCRRWRPPARRRLRSSLPPWKASR